MLLTSLHLIFDLVELSTKLTGTLTYKTDIIDDDEVSRLLENFREIVTRIVDDPDRCVSDMISDQVHSSGSERYL